MDFFAGNETDTLYPFGGTDYWITVKRELTAGEDRAVTHSALRKGSREIIDGKMNENEVGFEIDLDNAAFRKVATWLHDWNLCGPDKKTVDISSDAKKVSALRGLKPEKFTLIEKAIDAYVEARVVEKKVLPGPSGSSGPSVS